MPSPAATQSPYNPRASMPVRDMQGSRHFHDNRAGGARLHGGLVRHGTCRDEIAATYLGTIQFELARNFVKKALHCKTAFGIAGTPDRRGADLICLRDRNTKLIVRQDIWAGNIR